MGATDPPDLSEVPAGYRDDVAFVRDQWAMRAAHQRSEAGGPSLHQRAVLVHERMQADPRWAGAVPTLDQLTDSMRASVEELAVGGIPLFARATQLLPTGIERSLGGPPSAWPLLVSSTKASFFARVVHDPAAPKAYAVLMHPRLPVLLSVVARCLVEALPEDFFDRPWDLADLEEHVDGVVRHRPEPTLHQFSEAVGALGLGRPDLLGAKTVIPPQLARQFHLVFEASALFVLAHEAAHVELEHHAPETGRRNRLGADHVSSSVRDRELQADELGLSISAWALNVAAGLPLSVAAVGASAYFLAWEGSRVFQEAWRGEDPLAAVERVLRPAPLGADDLYPEPQQRRQSLADLTAARATHPALARHPWAAIDIVRRPFLAYTASLAHDKRGTEADLPAVGQPWPGSG